MIRYSYFRQRDDGAEMSVSVEEKIALLEAVKAGDEVKIKVMLFKGVDINIDLGGGLY